MIFDALLAALGVTLISLIGVFFFGHDKRLIGAERYIVPVAVGVFLSLIFYDLIPDTISEAPALGGIIIFAGFICFYIMSSVLHKRLHRLEVENCDQKGAAILILIGNSIHHLSDGFLIGSAFLINPTAGFAVALGIGLHEVPQEIVEFGVLIRAGYTRLQATFLNLLSATTVFFGTLLIILIAKQASGFVWILTGFAAGNLLYLAASDLLPRIHGNLKLYGNIWQSTIAIILGFSVMTGVITWTHTHYSEHATEQVR
jgi:zinc and cadmium transporter